MEFLNKVELKGIVGRAATTQVTDKAITNFSLMTQTAYNFAGSPAVEVTWFNCTTFNEVEIAKGDNVHCVGRLRIRRYTDQQGQERTSYDVVVESVTILRKAEETTM